MPSFLNNYLYEKGSTFWIGLTDRYTGVGQFVWIDQSEVVYTNWAPGEPDASYVSVSQKPSVSM
ncbi:unnamed protein product [Clavelina lepadiformis]|uniref:C-type lectin domain-containing protein n=1 Tax=Clavelina lepadiformis TaxID=159417 RepID=A0ABP0F0F0_CLALP